MSDAPDPAAEEKNSGKPDKKKPEKTAKPTAAKGEKPKKKGPNIVLILVPVAIAAALVLAFTLPPTHALIVKSPLRPLLAKVGLLPKDEALAAGKATPVSDPAADVKRLSNELDASKSDAAAKDALIAQLQSQLKAAAASPSPSPSPKATTSSASRRIGSRWMPTRPPRSPGAYPTPTSSSSSARCRPMRSATSWPRSPRRPSLGSPVRRAQPRSRDGGGPQPTGVSSTMLRATAGSASGRTSPEKMLSDWSAAIERYVKVNAAPSPARRSTTLSEIVAPVSSSI
jgi:hypothetical protein